MNTLKTVFTVGWNNGKMERYIDWNNENHGTSIQEDAMQFDTKEDAEKYIIEHKYYNCGVSSYEIEE